jgi:folylpolyglutamate synthase
MLTLMAIYTFCNCQSPKIDAMLLEVGMGGRYDCTNVFEPTQHNLIQGVTLIDYDHMRVLGSTLEQIAWEKGGIFCSDKLSAIGRGDGGYDVFVSKYKQSSTGENLHEKSRDGTKVFASGNNTQQVLDILSYIVNNDAQHGHLQLVNDAVLEAHAKIGLEGQHQRSNAALALSMCQHAMHKPLSTEKLQYALSQTFWPGRCHSVTLPSIRNEPTGIEASIHLRCDGAHTPISINACVEWFKSVASDKETIHRLLIFNCSHERNPLPLLYSLYQSKLFDAVYFCRADFERPSMLKKQLEEQWYNQDIGSQVTLRKMCDTLGQANCAAPTWQETLANVWKLFGMYESNSSNNICDVDQPVAFGLDVKTAVQTIQDKFASQRSTTKGRIEVCVTGSLYIVGSALEASGWEENSLECKLH